MPSSITNLPSFPQHLNIINSFKTTVKQMPKHNRNQGSVKGERGKPNRSSPQRKSEPELERITQIDISRIKRNPDQPRKDPGDADKIEDLARSIQQEGLIQPIIVRKKMDKYEIVVGERRWRACKAAGIDKVPAIIRDVNDHHLLIQSLIENLHRKDLTSIERENAVYDLWRSEAYDTKKDLADALGYHKSSITQLVEAKIFRDKQSLAAQPSTKLIYQTSGIKEDELRAKVIEKIQDDQITSDEVREFVKKFTKAPRDEREQMLGTGYKIDDENEEVNKDESEDKKEDKNVILITQIQRLERVVDKVVLMDSEIIGSLSAVEKKEMKVRLGSIAGKLDEVMKRL